MADERQDEDRIRELKKRLYSRSEDISGYRRHELQADKSVDKSLSDWRDDSGDTNSNHSFGMARTKRNKSILDKLLWFSVVFFVIAVGIAVISFQRGTTISPEKIDIEISGPLTIAAGEELSLDAEIRNRNDVDLELVDLLVEYPDGTREVDDVTRELRRYREGLGTIAAGETRDVSFDAVLFGQEGEEKEISVGIEYRVPGSNAIFFTDEVYTIELSSAPVTINVNAPEQINSGQTVTFDLEFVANTQDTIEDVLLVAEYPFGFSYTSSSMDPVSGDNVWLLGDISPQSTERISVTGVMTGQQNEERVMRFSIGIADTDNTTQINTPLATHVAPLAIRDPFLGLDVAINGDLGREYVAQLGEDIRTDITWSNNTDERISGAEIVLKFDGDVIDTQSISSTDGFYNSLNRRIIWDATTNRELSDIIADSRGQVSGSFSIQPRAQMAGVYTNPTVELEATMRGSDSTGNLTRSQLTTTVTKTVKVATDLILSARSLHFSGPITNSGPMPPQVGEETTYTITLSVSNAVNTARDVQVTAVLPSYVDWKEVISPNNANVSYNPVGGQVVWNVGSVEPGAGYNNAVEQVSFQVGLTPSGSQQGTEPVLLQDIRVSGRDAFTDTQVSDSVRNITTELTSDPQFSDGQGVVAP